MRELRCMILDQMGKMTTECCTRPRTTDQGSFPAIVAILMVIFGRVYVRVGDGKECPKSNLTIFAD